MQKRIRAGDLRLPVYLGAPVIGQDSAGAETITWDDVKTWGYIEPLAGKEWASATMLKENVDVRIVLRYNKSRVPSARWRVIDAGLGVIYDIQSAMVDPARGVVECMAKSAMGNVDAR